ncbi:hypothetical protein LOC68_17470 [Blastopirellula sp. JC732]|uniref:Uncharacterized protein n=1 Tax=Blastopirellula sediminis TaxID=2894196 RepID=A0A9X1MQI9_9BACT|nr:hypothetical protein [Blastopirellula sediminis]MCC9606515.1 hypothetical protein [Blastopirellula sediminis]MCC9630187.1 hypothetical protein [Blastopirellula sediminis]
MELGEALTRWSIRAALALLVVCCAGRQLAGERSRWQAIDRVLWPLGCGLFLTHIAAAIYFFHHGSQAEAYADIAQQTKQVLGAAVGEGLYVNYLMAVVWTADALWLLAAPTSYRKRPVWIEGAVLGFFLFIAFNGTVIFKSGWLRASGIIGTLVVAAAFAWRITRDRKSEA